MTKQEEVQPMSGEIVQVETTALESLTRGEVDIQIATAHKYPRSITKFKKSVRELACLDRETAAGCFYALPREGKVITGPTVRLAEIVASSWTNLRIAARIINEGETHLVAQGVCHDLETNVAKSTEIRRRITDKHGRKYSADMIATTANAAIAIASRNAIFQVVPMATIKDVLDEARKVAGGDEKSLGEGRKAAMAFIKKEYGIDEKAVLATLGKAGLADITTDDLATLRGFITAIKEGDATAETCFPGAAVNGSAAKGTAGLAEKLKSKPAEAPQTTKPAEVVDAHGEVKNAPPSDDSLMDLKAALYDETNAKPSIIDAAVAEFQKAGKALDFPALTARINELVKG